MLLKQNVAGKSLYKLLTVQLEKINNATNEKLNENLSNNVFFFNLLLRIFDVVEQRRLCKTS